MNAQNKFKRNYWIDTKVLSVQQAHARTTFIALLLVSTILYYLGTFVSLDDAYIYFRVSQNLLDGVGPVFNAGDNFTLATSPLWLLVLTIGKGVTGADYPTLAKFLTCLFLASAAWFTYLLLVPRLNLVGALSPLALFFMPSMAGLAGHDTALTLAMALLTLLSFQRRWTVLFPVSAALFYLARGEGAVVSAVLFVVWFWESFRQSKEVGICTLKRLLPGCLLALFLVAGWHAYHFAIFGTVFPKTLAVKILQGRNGWIPFSHGAQNHILQLIGDFRVVISLAIIVGIVVLAQRCWPIVIWPMVHFAVYTALGVAWYHWYYYPVEYVGTLATIVGATIALRGLVRFFGPVSGERPIALITVVVVFCIFLISPARAAFFNSPAKALAQLRITGTPVFGTPDARYVAYKEYSDAIKKAAVKSSKTLVSHEIGVFGYFLPDYEIRDVVGLAEPARSKEDLWNWNKVTWAYKPSYLFWTDKEPSPHVFINEQDHTVLKYFTFHPPVKDVIGVMYAKSDLLEGANKEISEPLENLISLWFNAVSLGQPARLFRENGDWKLLAHAPAILRIAVPDGAVGAKFGYGFLADVVSGRSNGAVFSVYLLAPNDKKVELLHTTISPATGTAAMLASKAKVSLPPGTGRHLEFVIDVNGDASWDWTYWSNLDFDTPLNEPPKKYN